MTGIPLGSRKVDLEQLQAELSAAGIAVPGLGIDNDSLVTYDAGGAPVDLPPAATALVTVHSPSTALRDQLVSALQTTVGVALPDLTQGQRLALIGALIYKLGGLTRQGQIKPLNQWLVN